MRIFLLTLIFSLFLVSCGQDKQEKNTTATQSNQTNVVEQTSDVSSTSQNAEGEYKLGVDYFELPTPYPTENESQVVVYEFFGYTCPHCFHFEPFLNKWLASKPNYADLQRVPLNFHPSWSIFQQAYLTAQTMGLVDKTHSQLFKALHEDHKRFQTIDELAAWYEDETGVDKDAFLSTAESFILDAAQRKADNTGFKMQISGTPSLVVNGKYKVSNKIKDKNKTIKVLNYLVEKEAASMGLVSR